MMHLEHLNMVVRDIPETLKFYHAAFPHWSVRGGGEDEWYGVLRKWVHFGDDFTYLTFNDHGMGNNRETHGNQLGLAHFAFTTTNLDAVATRLAGAGFEAHHAGAEHPTRRNLYFMDPNGFEIEFVQYLSDIPCERNTYPGAE